MKGDLKVLTTLGVAVHVSSNQTVNDRAYQEVKDVFMKHDLAHYEEMREDKLDIFWFSVNPAAENFDKIMEDLINAFLKLFKHKEAVDKILGRLFRKIIANRELAVYIQRMNEETEQIWNKTLD